MEEDSEGRFDEDGRPCTGSADMTHVSNVSDCFWLLSHLLMVLIIEHTPSFVGGVDCLLTARLGCRLPVSLMSRGLPCLVRRDPSADRRRVDQWCSNVLPC